MRYFIDIEEDDFIVEPRNKSKKNKEDDDWYPYEDEIIYKPMLMMAPQKKRNLEDYNFRRKKYENEQKVQAIMKKHLENECIPRDVIDEIFTKAGFYIPRVLVHPRKII